MPVWNLDRYETKERMNRPTGILRQHEMRATQQVAMQKSTQSLGRIQEYSSTPPPQSQRSAQATNMFITRVLDECGLEIKMVDEENMNNNDELNVSDERQSSRSSEFLCLAGTESRSRNPGQASVATSTIVISRDHNGRVHIHPSETVRD